MKEVNFKYVNANGEKSDRRVLVIEDNAGYVEGIDYTHLTKDKATALRAMASSKTTEFDPKGYMDAYRRFNRKNMTNIKEEIL